jgi:uncharacterized protein (TIGR03437 family)
VGVDGLITGLTSPLLTFPVTVQIDGIDAAVSLAEDAPDFVAGVLRVDAQIPAGVPPGPAVSVAINVGGAASQAGVTLAVK